MLPISFFPLFFALAIASALSAQKAEILPDWNVSPVELTALNSPYRDINLSITPNGRYLYFMSGRGGMPWSYPSYTTFRGKPEHDGDIWCSRKENGQWQPPQCLSAPINTSSGEDEPNISTDGQTVYFQSWRNWEYNGGPYYRAELRGEQWERPTGLGGGITRFFIDGNRATDGMSVSPDGTIIVIAAGPDYDGEMDIYVTSKDGNGVWAYPEKLDISTPKDDRSAFIGADNRTLYFASEGWGGFGQLDIFKTTLLGGSRCGPVYNIGKPFNTTEDDSGFVMDPLRNDVYFSRNGDIYYAHLGENIDERIKPAPVVVIEGTVTDPTGKGLESEITLLEKESGTIITRARSNAITGEYALSFPKKEGTYLQKIKIHEELIIEHLLEIDSASKSFFEMPVVADPAGEKTEVVEKAVPPLPPVEKKEPVEISMTTTVYFDFDRADISTEASTLLLEIIKRLTSSQNCTLTLAGHTDSIGPDDYNLRLAEKRARNVASFWLQNGVTAKTIIQTKGETEPAAPNDTPENRAQNRRVVIALNCKGE